MHVNRFWVTALVVFPFLSIPPKWGRKIERRAQENLTRPTRLEMLPRETGMNNVPGYLFRPPPRRTLLNLTFLAAVALATFAWSPSAGAAPPPACCKVTAIDAKSGLVTAQRSDGSKLQFQVTDARRLAQLKIGQAVWLDDRTATVSLEGAPNCCKLVEPKLKREPKLKLVELPVVVLLPVYDLAITAIPSTLQKVTTWSGSTTGKGPAPHPVAHHVLETMLKNNGNQTIRQAGVECTLRGPSPSGYVYPITFSSVSAGTEYKPGESRPFSVRSPGRIGIGGGIPPGGSYSVACTARIVQPSGVTESNTANNSLAGLVSTGLPDLTIRNLFLRDCATYGPAMAGKPVCAEIEYFNQLTGIVVSPWEVQCTMDGLVKTAPGPSQLPSGVGGILRIDFGTVAAGTRTLSCTVDSRNQVAETGENNNSMSTQVAVLSGANPVYDLAITAVGGTLRESSIWDGTRQQYISHLYFGGTTLKNNGNQAILQAGVECTLMTPSQTIAFHQSNPVEFMPGQSFSFTVYGVNPFSSPPWFTQIPSGPQGVSCTARILQPSGVTESNTANNTLTGTVNQ